MLLYAGKLNFIIHILRGCWTFYDLDGTPHVRVDEYMKHRLQNKLIRAILKDSL